MSGGQYSMESEEIGDYGPEMQQAYFFSSNDLWLEIVSAGLMPVSNVWSSLTVHSPEPGTFDLFFRTNLTASDSWFWIARGLPGQTNFDLVGLPTGGGFFVAGTTNSTDSNGLTAAYRALVGGVSTLTNDFDQDGLADAWEIANFGSLVQGANNDFDRDGSSNLSAFQNGSNPNTIRFSFSMTNRYCRFDPSPVPLSVPLGVPAEAAVLVDSTNTAVAVWTRYDSNLFVNLGATEGWHRVAVGLRGRSLAWPVVWQWTRLKLDETPPQIVLTNPVASAGLTPLIQLQGYSPEPLSSLHFTLSNTAGVVSNLHAFVNYQDYTTNAWEFTTNYFQCFDVALTDGTNAFAVWATDLAGNLTVTNFAVTIEDWMKTNPPSLRLDWPGNGMQISGSACAASGWLSNPSSTVTARVVDTNGVTNEITGMVERYGQFWVEDVPLHTGTNLISVEARDTWGHMLTTNLVVVKSELTLTIDPVSPSGLHRLTTSVSGTINASGYSVWVNGEPANVGADGNWTVENVPISSGNTATFVAVAAQGGGAGPAPQAGNAGTVSAQANVDKPDRVFVKKFSTKRAYHSHTSCPDPGGFETDMAWKEKYSWDDGKGGRGENDSSVSQDDLGSSCHADMTWGATF